MIKKHLVSIILGVIATVFCTGALILAYESTILGTVYLRTSGNPEEVLQAFYDFIEAKDYENAYSCLAEYSDLGLDGNATNSNNAMVMKALRDSYRGTIITDVLTDGLKANATVRFVYLDIDEFQNIVGDNINPLLASYVEDLPRTEIYDENGDYKTEFLQMVYDEVLKDVVYEDTNIYKSIEYEVDLQYTNKGWKVLTNKDMLKGFLGGKNA